MSVPASAAPTPKPGLAVSAAVGLVVAAVVATLALVALVVSLTDDRLPTGPALAPPPAPTAAVDWNPTTRDAQFGRVGVTLPMDPYDCPSSLSPLPGVLDSAVICNAVVHAKYDGSNDWTATAGFGSVPSDLTRPTAEGTSKAMFEAVRQVAFTNQETTEKKITTQTVTLGGQEVVAVSGDIHYEIDNLPSSYDRLFVVAIPVDHDTYAAYFSVRPNDTPEQTLAALNTSINRLRVS